MAKKKKANKTSEEKQGKEVRGKKEVVFWERWKHWFIIFDLSSCVSFIMYLS